MIHADIGAHVSAAGGLESCFANARECGAGAAQIFVKSPRQWAARPLAGAEAVAFRKAHAASGLGAIVAHSTYLVNLAAREPEILAKSIACLADELARADALGLAGVIVHPGSSPDGREVSIARIAAAIPEVLKLSGARTAELILEGTAGGGGQVGGRFEDLRDIIDALPPELRGRIGVCVDTCHMHVAGYSLCGPGELAKLLDELDRVVGLSRLRAIHVNDSKGEKGSRLDRHANLGEGTIGLDCFAALVNDPRLASVPKVLETPEEDDGHRRDVALLVALREGRKVAAAKAKGAATGEAMKTTKAMKSAKTTKAAKTTMAAKTTKAAKTTGAARTPLRTRTTRRARK